MGRVGSEVVSKRGRNEAKRGGEGARQSSFSGVSFLLSVVGGPLSQHAYKAVFIGNVAARTARRDELNKYSSSGV